MRKPLQKSRFLKEKFQHATGRKKKKKKSGHMRVGKRSFASITPSHEVPQLREKAGWQSLPWGKGESSESVPS